MAAASARAGVKTLVMDCDFGSPSFQANLPCTTNPDVFGNDFLLGTNKYEKAICSTELTNLDSIFANPKPVLGKGLLTSSEKVHWKALQNFSQLREKLEELGYQRLFLDTSPNLTYSSASALTVADSIVLVHRPTTHSLDITIYILQAIYTALKKSLKPRPFFLIYNQVPHGTPEEVANLLDTLTSEIKKHIDIEVLGSIPLNPKMDFWNNLLIHEGSELLNTLDVILKRVVES